MSDNEDQRRKKRSSGGSIFDRLTNPENYTGTQRRKALDGDSEDRDAGNVHDLSEITRGSRGRSRGRSDARRRSRSVGRDVLDDGSSTASRRSRSKSRSSGRHRSRSRSLGRSLDANGKKDGGRKSRGRSRTASGKDEKRDRSRSRSRSRPPADKGVLDRLTDSQYYTGRTREMFDEDGRGRGRSGTTGDDADGVNDLSDITRSEQRGSSNSLAGKPRRRKKSSGPIEKFGVQAKSVRTVWVYRNGDLHAEPMKIYLNKTINSFDKLLKELTTKVKLPTGACRKIYLVDYSEDKGNTHRRVKELDDLEDGMVYIACGAESVNKDKYPLRLGFPRG